MAKRCVLRGFLNEIFDCEFLMSYGSLFQITGPVYEKDLRLKDFFIIQRVQKKGKHDNQSLVDFRTKSHNTSQRSMEHWFAGLLKIVVHLPQGNGN